MHIASLIQLRHLFSAFARNEHMFERGGDPLPGLDAARMIVEHAVNHEHIIGAPMADYSSFLVAETLRTRGGEQRDRQRALGLLAKHITLLAERTL